MGDDELSSIEVNCIVAAMFIMEAPFYALPNPACAVSSENNEVSIHSDATTSKKTLRAFQKCPVQSRTNRVKRGT